MEKNIFFREIRGRMFENGSNQAAKKCYSYKTNEINTTSPSTYTIINNRSCCTNAFFSPLISLDVNSHPHHHHHHNPHPANELVLASKLCQLWSSCYVAKKRLFFLEINVFYFIVPIFLRCSVCFIIYGPFFLQVII